MSQYGPNIRRTVAASSRYSAGMRRPCGDLRAISIRSVYYSLIHFHSSRISPSFSTRRLRTPQLARNFPFNTTLHCQHADYTKRPTLLRLLLKCNVHSVETQASQTRCGKARQQSSLRCRWIALQGAQYEREKARLWQLWQNLARRWK
jgi:hypothetical protein